MSRRKKKKLVFQFLSFILPFILLSIGSTGLILSLTNYNYFQKIIHQDYATILKSSAGEIRQFMDNSKRNLESLALVTSATKPESWQKEVALAALLHNKPQFVSMDLFYNNSGVIRSAISGAPLPGNSDEGVIDRAFFGKTSISGIIADDNETPHANMAVPVFRLGKVEEVLWADLDLKAIWDVLEGITVGTTGQVYILDSAGRTIAHRKIDRVFQAVPAISPKLINDIRSAQLPVEWTEDTGGSTKYNLGTYIPGLEWIVVLSQPVSETYAYLYRNLVWAVFVIVFICSMAVFFGWRWTRRFLLPIQTLHREVRLIGQGNLDRNVSVKTENEIGDLGIAFNQMTDSLRAYIDREVETAKALAHSKNLALLGTASSKMTHEVGNFLNNTHMAIAGLKREPLSQRGEKILSIMENESGRVSEFIRKFLLFAKKPELTLQKTSLELIIREILTIVGPDAENRGIDITLNWDAAIPPVNIDAGMMSQVINNLLKNSMDAIPDSERVDAGKSNAGTIEIHGRIEDDSLVISFRDSGQGIEPENLEMIFEPFFTTKGGRGTGLGMPIVKTAVEAHGGSIECKSTPGKGTEVSIRLPIR